MMLTLEQIEAWRELISRGRVELCLKEMEEFTEEMEPATANMVIHFNGRFNELKRQEMLGTVASASASVERNKIVYGLLGLLSELESVLEKPSRAVPDITGMVPDEISREIDLAAPPAPGPQEEGAILYQIPEKMQLNQATRCIVRLAFDEATVKRGMEEEEDTVVKGIRVESVMGVELLDPNTTATFNIRRLSDEAQFVEEGDYTEWIFKVTPLRRGTFPIMLKVSVIVIIDGRERKKNIVLEEMIDIVTTGTEGAPGSDRFKSHDPAIDSEKGVPLFISWSMSERDKTFKQDFVNQMAVLRLQGLLHHWDRTMIPAGESARDSLRNHLSQAAVFVVLISPDYLSNQEFFEELSAIQRQQNAREAVVIPILLRPCNFNLLPIGRLQVLPRDGQAVSQAADTDAAWADIVQEIHRVVQLLERVEE